jgi:hypothetical protein
MNSILKDYTNLYNILVDITSNNKYNYESYCNKKGKTVGKNLNSLNLEGNDDILNKIGDNALCCIKEYRNSNTKCDFDTNKAVLFPEITDWTKWGDISAYLEKIHNATNNIVEKNENNIENNLDIQVKLLKKKNGYIKTIAIFFAILYFVFLFYVFKSYIWEWKNLTYDEKYNIRGTFKHYLCDGISIIVFLLYIGKAFIFTHLESFSSNYKELTDNLINIDEHEITEMLKTIKNINIIITQILCSENCEDGSKPDDRFNKNSSELISKINDFINTYKKLQKKENSTNNLYTKSKLLTNINDFFGELKGLVYRNNNKFNNLIINNSNEVQCLMKLVLLNKCDDDKSLKCYLNNQCGLQGFFKEEKYSGASDFKNGLEDVTYSDIETLYDILTKNTINSTIRFKLQNHKLFKIIENIFIFKIKYYNLRKDDFTIYIYNYFHKLNLVDNGITLDKFDIIRNYKILIDIIYTNYNSHKKIDSRSVPSTVIDKNKFRLIINLYTTNDINKIKTNLNKTINNIITYKKLFSREIKNEITNEKESNNNLGTLIIVIGIISFVQFSGIVWDTGVFDDNLKETNLTRLRGMRNDLRKQKISKEQRNDDKKRKNNEMILEKEKLKSNEKISLAKVDASKMGSIPGAMPGYPGAMPSYPGAMPGAMPNYPGAMPNYPGAMPGAMPGTMKLGKSQKGGITKNDVLEEDQKLKKPIEEKEFPIRATKLCAIFSSLLLVNTIIGSYWFKQKVNTAKREMILLNSENEFEEKLRELQSYLTNIEIIKKLDQYKDNKKDLDNILNDLDINVNDEGDKILFSKHSKENDYIILDKTDVKELVYEELYYKLINLSQLYDCCFLAKRDKKVIFPWTELSINVILYLISLTILGYILTTDELKPTILIEKLSGHYKKLQTQFGGAENNSDELNKLTNNKDILLNIIITLLSLYFSYNIYNSTIDYQTYMFN